MFTAFLAMAMVSQFGGANTPGNAAGMVHYGTGAQGITPGVAGGNTIQAPGKYWDPVSLSWKIVGGLNPITAVRVPVSVNGAAKQKSKANAVTRKAKVGIRHSRLSAAQAWASAISCF
jgi:hypothetical protein